MEVHPFLAALMDATQLRLQIDHDTLTNQQPVGAAQVSGAAGRHWALGMGHARTPYWRK